MKRTTSRSEARQALFKPQAVAAEERKRLELANVGDLTTLWWSQPSSTMWMSGSVIA